MKICKDCKHINTYIGYSVICTPEERYRCYHPDLRTWDFGIDPVTGEEIIVGDPGESMCWRFNNGDCEKFESK